ncbi:MAG TPA: hypothetical protein VM580_25985 [Labilithrix sp.]|jgi:hypothetical protein|nr:hypothetical protein [Labilithrix sp.]
MTAYRPPESADDRNFVISGWSSSYRTSHQAGFISMKRWPAVMRVEIEDALDRPNVRTLLAVDKKNPSSLSGFIVADTTPQFEKLERGEWKEWPAMLYYVFVKGGHRRYGVARGLFDAIGLDPRSRFLVACKTPWFTRLASKVPNAKMNPLVARFAT